MASRQQQDIVGYTAYIFSKIDGQVIAKLDRRANSIGIR